MRPSLPRRCGSLSLLKTGLGVGCAWLVLSIGEPRIAEGRGSPADASCTEGPAFASGEDLAHHIRRTARHLHRLTRVSQVPWSGGIDAVVRHLARIQHLRRLLRAQLERLARCERGSPGDSQASRVEGGSSSTAGVIRPRALESSAFFHPDHAAGDALPPR